MICVMYVHYQDHDVLWIDPLGIQLEVGKSDLIPTLLHGSSVGKTCLWAIWLVISRSLRVRDLKEK